MLAVSESYIIGIDISTNGDTPVVSVVKRCGSNIEHVNTISGDQALLFYDILLRKSDDFSKFGVIRTQDLGTLVGELEAFRKKERESF